MAVGCSAYAMLCLQTPHSLPFQLMQLVGGADRWSASMHAMPHSSAGTQVLAQKVLGPSFPFSIVLPLSALQPTTAQYHKCIKERGEGSSDCKP